MNTKTIEQIAKLILTKNSLPIVQNMKVENNTITMTDLELSIEINHESKMNGILSLQEIPFYLDGDKNHREQEIEEYPSIFGKGFNYSGNSKTFIKSDLKALSDACKFASNDESRQNICCVLLEPEAGKLKIVATNCHYLYASNIDKSWDNYSVLLPVKNLEKVLRIAKLLGEDGFFFNYDDNKSLASFGFNNATVYLRCIDGQFPDYRQVFPKGNSSVWELKNIDSKAINGFLTSSLKHNVSIVGKENQVSKRRGIHKIMSQLGIKIHLNSAITLKYKDLASFTIEAEKLTGNDLDICLDANYLDVVLGLKPNYLKIKDALSPVIFEIDENTTALMMPMRME